MTHEERITKMRTVMSVVLLAVVLGLVHPRTYGQDATQKPEFVRAPDALERVTWRTRTLVGDERLTNWKLAISTAGFRGLTFLDGVVRADAAVVDFVEGSSTQNVSAALPKPLDWNLTREEVADIRARMGTVKMIAYRVDNFPSDAAGQRKLFEFAKAMGVDTLVTNAKLELTGPAALADEFGINLACLLLLSQTPGELTGRLQTLTRRVGVGASAADALAAGNRLMYVDVRGATPALFHELNRRNIRPLVLALDTSALQNASSDLYRVIDAFEAAVQPAFGANFTEFSRTRPIRRDLVRPARGETLTDAEITRRSEEALQKIRAAIPPKAYATPKKPRKLLVIESLQGMSHDTIPHANVMLDEMGRITGAWTTEFNNDLNNLKYPKIKDYDGVFLNSIVGEFAADLEVRDGLARFVREGGGLGGIHGTPWASRNWDEFAEMIGSQSAPHRIEQGVMKVYDATSPLMKPLGGRDLNFREEYYRFEHEGRGRLRWDKVRVLMTVALDDPKIEPRPWNGYKRPDNIYPVSWIREYGKGRVFYSSLGHMPETFMTPELVGHFLAGVQYLLGDLGADATPNPIQTGSGGASAPPERTSSGAPSAQPAASPATPPIPSISERPTGSSLGMIRVGAADNNIWFGWRVGMTDAALKGATLSEMLAKADAYPISLPSVVASSTQILSAEVPKPVDYRLQTGERAALTYHVRELNEQILAYHAPEIGGDVASRRKMFEFAKAINAPLVITNADATNLAELDTLATEFGISVALESKTDPRPLVAALEGRSARIGIAADLGAWIQAGIKPVDALASVKSRLLLVRAADRSAFGANGRSVPPGDGVGALSDFFLAAYHASIKPLSITISASGTTAADYLRDVSAFERMMWPAMAERVRTMLASPAGQIRGPDRLKPEERQQIAAAAPRRALATPRKPRKLLVTDIQMYSGHSTIPHGNLLLELMAKNTGAFEPTFSNDLSLLKYPAIKQFDAIYLNNVCGMVYNDPEVRDGILRFVREGGGIGGHHAVTFANNNWPEFAEMMGGWAGAHHIEKQMIKVDDAASPLTRSFGSASFEHTDEFYIFPPYSPYSREKQHVLLSIDVEKSDRATANRFCAQCTRPDQDYGLAWIRMYGKGRTYFTPLGHTNIFYTDKRWTEHLLAAIQYILGDLEADASPRRGTGEVRSKNEERRTKNEERNHER
jgi:type 1 glutamine amidotransferase/sugar phosphate isomerase/epimerase